MSHAELERTLTRLRVEEASLRDSLSKMSALNEGLAQDKAELHRLVIQVQPGGGSTVAGRESVGASWNPPAEGLRLVAQKEKRVPALGAGWPLAQPGWKQVRGGNSAGLSGCLPRWCSLACRVELAGLPVPWPGADYEDPGEGREGGSF